MVKMAGYRTSLQMIISKQVLNGIIEARLTKLAYSTPIRKGFLLPKFNQLHDMELNSCMGILVLYWCTDCDIFLCSGSLLKDHGYEI